MKKFIQKYGVLILGVVFLITFFRSCSKNGEIRKLNKTNVELSKTIISKDSLLQTYKHSIDSFPEKIRQTSLILHQEYDAWISKRDRGQQLMELHNDFVKVKIKNLSE